MSATLRRQSTGLQASRGGPGRWQSKQRHRQARRYAGLASRISAGRGTVCPLACTVLPWPDAPRSIKGQCATERTTSVAVRTLFVIFVTERIDDLDAIRAFPLLQHSSSLRALRAEISCLGCHRIASAPRYGCTSTKCRGSSRVLASSWFAGCSHYRQRRPAAYSLSSRSVASRPTPLYRSRQRTLW